MGPSTPENGATLPDNGPVVLRADMSAYSTVVTCTRCPSFRVVAATRAAAMREALPHAAMHGEAKAARDATRDRRRRAR